MKFHSLFLTSLMALSLSMGSCSNDNAIKAPDGESGGVNLTFNIGVASQVGDDGDSRADYPYHDPGLAGERAVNNAVIIIYDRPINAADAENGEIVNSFYVTGFESFTPSNYPDNAEYFDPNSAFYPQSDVLNTISVGKVLFSDYYRKKIEVKPEDGSEFEVGNRYYATAICNFGDVTDQFKPGTSLSKLRDYIYEDELYDPVSGNISSYTNFRMSGINETSFIWQQQTEGKELKLGDFMVQRLAARLDVTIEGTDFLNYSTYSTDGDVRLAVYTDNETTGNLEVNSSYDFYLTDLEIVNNVEKKGTENNQNTRMYLIERSSKVAPDQNATGSSVMYFDNEGWDSKRNATKYVYSPSGKNFETVNLHSVAGYGNLAALIAGGGYSVSGKNAIVGYLAENTNSSTHHTALRIKGKTNATTGAIFTGSRAVPDGYNSVEAELPIYHSQAIGCMRDAVVRNTIYRIRIKVVARDSKIYFEYYYVYPNGSNQRPLTATGFLAEVGQASGTIIPND